MAQESSIKSRSPIATHPVTSAAIAILTVAVIFFAIYVPLYARATPKVGDFPFFYMIFGAVAAYKVATPTTSHWAGSVDIEFGHTVYIGLSALVINVAIAVILTLVCKTARVPAGADETLPRQVPADSGTGELWSALPL